MRLAIASLTAGLTLMSLPRPAGATPLLDPHVGGLVFVGPTSPSVSAIFWNPAAAGLMRGTHILFTGGARLDLDLVHRAPIDTSTGEAANATTLETNRRSFGSDTLTPVTPGAFVGISSDLKTESVTVGFASYVPFAQSLSSADDLRYHQDGGSFYAIYNTISVSFRATNRLIFGGGFNFISKSLSLRYREDTALPGCSGTTTGCVENPAAARSYSLRGYNILPSVLGFNFGIMVKPTSRMWIGLAYVSTPRTFSGQSIHLDFNGSATITPAPDEMKSGDLHGNARVLTTLPQMINVGARYEIVAADIGQRGLYGLASLRWVDTASHEDYVVQLSGKELRDAGIPELSKRWRGFDGMLFSGMLTADAGLEEAAGSQWRLGAHLRLSSPGVPLGAVAPDQIDGWSAELAGGLETRISTSWTLTLHSSVGAMLPRTVGASDFSPSSAIDCTKSGYDLDVCAAARRGSAIPTAAGSYQQYTFDVMVGLSYDTL